MVILKILLYSLIILFPLGVIPRVSIFNGLNFYPIDIVLFLIFLYWVFYFIKKKEKRNNLVFFKEFYLFILVALISLAINFKNLTPISFLISFMYLFRLILYSSLIFIFIFFDKKFSRRYLSLLALSGLLVVILGIFQYFLYPDLRNLYYLGWDKHFYRIFSTFLDPNFAGAIFVLVLILFVSIYQTVQKNSLKSNFLYLIPILLTTAAIFLTYSRSSLIMFLVSISSYLFITNQKKIILVLFIAFLVGIFLLPKNFGGEGLDLLRTSSIISRGNTYKDALTISKDSPIIGVGFNSYRYSQEKYGFLDPKNWDSTHSGAGIPNSYLFILATTGIVGVVVFMNFWYRIFVNLFINIKSSNKYFSAAVMSSTIGISVHSLFENTIFYPYVMIWIFILFGISLVYDRS